MLRKIVSVGVIAFWIGKIFADDVWGLLLAVAAMMVYCVSAVAIDLWRE